MSLESSLIKKCLLTAKKHNMTPIRISSSYQVGFPDYIFVKNVKGKSICFGCEFKRPNIDKDKACSQVQIARRNTEQELVCIVINDRDDFENFIKGYIY